MGLEDGQIGELLCCKLTVCGSLHPVGGKGVR